MQKNIYITPASISIHSHSLWDGCGWCASIGWKPGSRRPRHLTRLGVAKDRWTAAESRTAAVITAAATAAAQAAPPSSDHHLYLFRGTHWDTERRQTEDRWETGRESNKAGYRLELIGHCISLAFLPAAQSTAWKVLTVYSLAVFTWALLPH